MFPRQSVRIRKFPFPFRCGLAICNDPDYLTEDTFVELHRFLNTSDETSIGKGLDMEVGDGMFMYSANPSSSGFSYFDGITTKFSKSCGTITEFASAGLIDVLHTYGDFHDAGGFIRMQAESAIKELVRAKIRLEVWTNHGGSMNIQNVSNLQEQAYYQEGDDPDCEAYHTDLTVEYGIRFFCFDSGLQEHQFVHDRSFSLDGLRDEFTKTRDWKLLEKFQSAKLLQKATLRDFQKVYSFNRFRGGERPNIKNIHQQIASERLRLLEAYSGYVIVYTHFGYAIENGRVRPSSPLDLNTKNRSALANLSELYHKGRMLVTTTSKLIKYYLISKRLRWSPVKTEKGCNIKVLGIDDPLGVYGRLTEGMLQGLTFYTEKPRQTTITILKGDEEVQLENLHENPKDHTGRRSISLPWVKSKFPR